MLSSLVRHEPDNTADINNMRGATGLQSQQKTGCAGWYRGLLQAHDDPVVNLYLLEGTIERYKRYYLQRT